MNKIISSVGRKLASVIIGPILTAALIAGNAILPEGARLSGDQITTVVEWLLGTILAFLATQGAHDVVKGSSTAGTTTQSVTTPTVPNVVGKPSSPDFG